MNPKRVRIAVAVSIALWQSSASSAADHSTEHSRHSVIEATYNAEFTVNSLEKSLPFYRDGLGLSVAPRPGPPPGAKPMAPPPPGALATLTGVIGGVPKIERLAIPGVRWQLELIQMTQVEHRTLDLKRQDVGSATLIGFVRDLRSRLQTLVAAGAQIVTNGGEPIRVSTPEGPALAIALRDPDGFGIELRQLEKQSEAAPTNSDILRAGISITAANLQQTASYWHRMLNFDFPTKVPTRTAELQSELVGTPGTSVYRLVAHPPGNGPYWEFLQFQPGNTQQALPRLQDPGNAAFIVLTQDLDTLVQQLRGSPDTHILSLGRTYVPRFNDGGAIFFQEKNGIFLEGCKGC